jgi:alpha-amylase/alpha-mannosidase (GH57 family)
VDRFICIHGHFYQPPRENPWLEAVELQDSAYPYHDWNARITAECYAANATSRILDERRRIEKIVNNYSRISFNFGPTLLSWLESHAPDTYRAIIEADRQSQLRFGGHGSALAQAYNHMIMPLASRRDMETQVIWGIRDFERRFRRFPEGMWLPETAVDTPTLEVLASRGIAFTILAPHQAFRVRKIGETPWTDVSGGRVDPSQPYLAKLPSGKSIAIFFYDGPISRSVAFDHLLNSGEAFANRLLSLFGEGRGKGRLAHIATDGETYGHHHMFGDMALAYAINSIESNGLARLTNYGEYHARHEPAYEVEIVENTSWSCAHGIDRWRSACGCHTGGAAGWHQEWRAPLRAALDWLRDTLVPHFESAGAAYFSDPWDARDDYIRVVLDRSDDTVADFLREHAGRELNAEETVSALKLLEIQRHAMLMYTSCGWFFNEVSGIETVQVLQYAARAIQLAEQMTGNSLEEEFIRRLEPARSNVPEHGDGAAIYRNQVRPLMIGLESVGAHYAAAAVFHPFPSSAKVYAFEIEREDYETVELGRARVSAGAIRVTSEITRESERFSFALIYLGDVHLAGGIKPYEKEAHERLRAQLSEAYIATEFTEVMRLLDRNFGGLTLSIKSLFKDDQRSTLAHICNSTLMEAEAALRRLHDRYLPLMRYHLDLGVPLPKVLKEVAEFDLNLLLRRALERDDLPVEMIESLLKRVRNEQLSLDVTSIAYVTRQTVERIAEQFTLVHDRENLRRLEAAVALTLSLPFTVDLRNVQNVYYRSRSLLVPDVVVRANDGDEEAREWLARFRSLGEMLSIREA